MAGLPALATYRTSPLAEWLPLEPRKIDALDQMFAQYAGQG
jgi:hypothetical protein